jgi:aminoglycoside 2'-N-acetyltransferase I
VLGGNHTLVIEDDELIGHASVVKRRMLHGGKALPSGYIEGVAVRGDRRRRVTARCSTKVSEGVNKLVSVLHRTR